MARKSKRREETFATAAESAGRENTPLRAINVRLPPRDDGNPRTPAGCYAAGRACHRVLGGPSENSAAETGGRRRASSGRKRGGCGSPRSNRRGAEPARLPAED